mgnify:CR=1 FL=1
MAHSRLKRNRCFTHLVQNLIQNVRSSIMIVVTRWTQSILEKLSCLKTTAACEVVQMVQLCGRQWPTRRSCCALSVTHGLFKVRQVDCRGWAIDVRVPIVVKCLLSGDCTVTVGG